MAERPGATPPQSAQPAIASSTPSAAKPDIDAASKSARAAVEAQKKKLVEACWEPAGATAKGSEAVTYTINFTFGPDGKQVARGIAEPRGASRPRLVNCMQLALPPVTIPPPGEAIALEVPFTLP